MQPPAFSAPAILHFQVMDRRKKPPDVPENVRQFGKQKKFVKSRRKSCAGLQSGNAAASDDCVIFSGAAVGKIAVQVEW